MGASQSTTAFALYPSTLTVVSRETVDSDGDGFLDQIRITTLQSLNDNFGGLVILVAGHSVLSIDSGSTGGDNVFVVRISEGARFDTGDTPLVQVVSGGSLKSADGLYSMVSEGSGVAATDKAAPVLGVTLAAVGGTRIYLEFSEAVFTDSLASAPPSAADFTYASTGLTTIESVGVGIRKAFLNLAAPLTGDNVASDTIAPVNASAVYDGAGNPMSVVVRPISLLGLGVVAPVWASSTVGTDTATITRFDGTAQVRDGDIQLQSSTVAASLTANAVDLYLDSNIPASVKSGALWLPSPATLPGLISQSDPTAETIPQDTVSGALRDFSVPAADPNIAAGRVVEFILGVQIGPQTLYCMGVTDVNDPRTLRPYSFKIAEVPTQRGAVKILSNVMAPATGGKTTLTYTVTKPGPVTIQVFTMYGAIVAVLHSGADGAGDHSVTWDGRNAAGKVVARGIYFIRAVGPDFDEVRKVLLIR